jgi:hypothetical protein
MPTIGAEQAQQRGDRGDGAERVEEALEVERDRAARVLDGVLDHLARALLVDQRRRRRCADERAALQAVDEVLRDALGLVLANCRRAGRRAGRRGKSEGTRTLADDGERDDEVKMMNQIGQPAASMIDSTRALLLLENRGHFSPRSMIPQGLVVAGRGHKPSANRLKRWTIRVCGAPRLPAALVGKRKCRAATSHACRIIHRACG